MLRGSLGLATVVAVLSGAATASAAAPGDLRSLAVLPDGSGGLLAADVRDSVLPPQGSVSDDGRWVVFSSESDGFSPEDVDTIRNAYLRDTASSGPLTLVSRGDDDQPVTHFGGSAPIAVAGNEGSPLVLFATAQRLDAADGNDSTDLYVRDVTAGTTRLVSRRDGGGQAVGATSGDISDDGDWVVFSTSTKVDAVDDTNATSDVYRYSMLNGTVSLMSRISSAGVVGNGSSDSAVVSDTGVVAFASTATNFPDDADTDTDIFRRSTAGTVTLVSRATGDAGAAGNDDSFSPRLSPDGLDIAFLSASTNLVPGDADTTLDVYVRRTSGVDTTVLASVPTGPVAGANASPGSSATNHSIAEAPDGDLLVGFGSETTFAAGATGSDGYLRNVTTETTTLVGPGAGPGGFLGATSPMVLAADGGSVAFASARPGLTADQSAETSGSVFRRTVDPTGPVQLVSRPAGTAPLAPAFGFARVPGQDAITADGRYVLLQSPSNLLLPPGSPTAGTPLYRHDARTRTTIPVSVTADGTVATVDGVQAGISDDGTRVAFASLAQLTPDDTDGTTDVFVRDIVAGTTTLVSRKADGDPAGVQGFEATISGDGHSVVFRSGNDLTDEGANVSLVYVRRLDTGTTVVASRGPEPLGGDDQPGSAEASISTDGSKVAFVSRGMFGDAGGDDLGSTDSVYVRDLVAGTTTLVSRATGDGPDVDDDVSSAHLSGDGRHVAFVSIAGNLGAPAGTDHAYVRDLVARTTDLVSLGSGGAALPNGIADDVITISDDGSRVAFRASGIVADGDLVTSSGLYVRDRTAAATIPVLRGPGVPGAPAGGGGSAIALAGGGDCAAFTAFGSSLVPGVSPDVEHAYLRTLRGTCPDAAPTPPGGPAGPGGPGGGTTPAVPLPVPGARDTVAPRITSARLLRSRFRVAAKRTAVSAAARRRRATPAGTTLTVRLTEAATLRLAVQRERPGRRSGRRCVAPSRRLRRARTCTRTSAVRTLTRRLKAGTRRISFTGRIAARKLAPGRYRFVLRATDAAGNRSAARTVRFTVVSR